MRSKTVQLFLEFPHNQCSYPMTPEAEGIFRINAENIHEEYVREQNGGVVPEGVDIHCLAGTNQGLVQRTSHWSLDSLSSEQMAHPLTIDVCSPSDELPQDTHLKDPERKRGFGDTENDNEEKELAFLAEEPLNESFRNYSQSNEIPNTDDHSLMLTADKLITDAYHVNETPAEIETFTTETDAIVSNNLKPATLVIGGKTNNIGQSSNSCVKESNKIIGLQLILQMTNTADKTKGITNLSRIDSRIEHIEAWR
ncbi:Ribosomal protein S25 family protein [Hibiscus syriacus]|uniref:Ribosomal protein S25 family protein n=1 Tax=Hibiscus syriacus TaxID=106335 RepID=A0A6A2ZI82_HIBSY|nr:Ribosomal protein S25 family protein [Hibiscus syriacus]